MRGLGSKMLVAAVFALVLAATVDALRSVSEREPEQESSRRSAPAEPIPREAVAGLRANRVGGRLVLVQQGCRLRSLRLPELTPEAPPPLRCAAFTPHGRLGLRNGEVAWFAEGDGQTVVLSRAELEDTLARDEPTFVRAGAHVRRVAWLGHRRFLALVENARRDQLLALLEGSEIFWSAPTRGVDWVRASPRGSFVAAHFRSGGVLLLDRDGQPLRIPRTIAPVRALAWAPDERWAAVATPRNVFVVRSGAHWPLVRLPLVVEDVGWRD